MKTQTTFNTSQSITREIEKVTKERDAMISHASRLTTAGQKSIAENRISEGTWELHLAKQADRSARNKVTKLERLKQALAEMNTDMLPTMARDKFDRQVVLPKLKK